MSKIDSTIVLTKLDFMDRYLTQLERFASVSLEEYKADFNTQLAVERLIILIVQVGVDINFHILKRLNMELPELSKDAVFEIAKLEIIEEELAFRLSESVQMRNLLVHLYEIINPDIVHQAIRETIQDYSLYQRRMIEYLESLEVNNG